MAEGYGIKSVRINKDEELKSKIKEVLNFKGPVICDVNCKEFQYYVDTFKKHLTNQPDDEVTFDIQTNAIETITI